MASQFLTHGKKIIAIGRNYANHAKELNNAVPTTPFFFLKPTTCYTALGKDVKVEVAKGVELHHEVELGLVIGKAGTNIPRKEAMKHIGGYCLAIDYTGRNLQDAAKKKGLPWSAAKGFDTWCPTSPFIPSPSPLIKDPQNLVLSYKINGKTQQEGNTSDMIFKIDELVEYVSGIMRLEVGDLIITGTPEGVSRVVPGDHITAFLHNPEGELITSLEHVIAEKSTNYVA